VDKIPPYIGVRINWLDLRILANANRQFLQIQTQYLDQFLGVGSRSQEKNVNNH